MHEPASATAVISSPTSSTPRLKTSPAARVFSPIAFGCAALSVVLTIFLALGWLHRLSMPGRTDFGILYAAGRLAQRGHLASTYHLHALYRMEVGLSGSPNRTWLPFPFPYPPHVAAVLGLLARLPLQPAFNLWIAVNLAAYGVACFLALRRLNGRLRLLGGLGLAGCLPLVISTVQGENSGVLALGLILMLQAFESPLAMAPAIVLLSTKPQMLLVPMVVVLVRHRRVEMAGAAAGLLLVGIAGLMVGGVQGYKSFLSLTLRSTHWTTRYHFWGPKYNYSLVAQIHGLVGYGRLSTILWLMASVLLLLMVLRLSRMDTVSWLAISAAMLLLAGHLPFHDLTILYPAAVVALASRLRWFALALLVIPWLDPALYGMTGIHLVVILCLAVSVAMVLGISETGAARRMERYVRGREKSALWKLSERPRWGSVSGSETQSTL